MTEPTVFVVDDDPAVLDSLQRLLTSQGHRVECFSSGEAYLEGVAAERAGCLVVDLRMPGVTGLQLLQQLASAESSRPTVVISGHAEIASVVQAMKLGAVDVLEKPFQPSHLLKAVQAALVVDAGSRGRIDTRRRARERINQLSADERAVLGGIAHGLTNRQIAEQLDVSLRTVQFRRSSLMEALKVSSRSELIELVLQADWSPD